MEQDYSQINLFQIFIQMVRMSPTLQLKMELMYQKHRLIKNPQEELSFKHGLSYSIEPTKIHHVQFKFASTTPDIEDCNLRIYDENDLTLILFRAGRGGLIRVNEKQMIDFYNSSISTDANLILTQIDLVLDWENQHIQIFVNSKYKDKCKFFQNGISNVSEILLYNLYASVSYWSELVVCSEICYGFNWERSNYVFMTLMMLVLFLTL